MTVVICLPFNIKNATLAYRRINFQLIYHYALLRFVSFLCSFITRIRFIRTNKCVKKLPFAKHVSHLLYGTVRLDFAFKPNCKLKQFPFSFFSSLFFCFFFKNCQHDNRKSPSSDSQENNATVKFSKRFEVYEVFRFASLVDVSVARTKYKKTFEQRACLLFY